MLFSAPSPALTTAWIVLASLALSVLLWPPPGDVWYTTGFLAVLAPVLIAAVVTTPFASALGGRFEFHRGVLLAFSGLLLEIPLAAAWRGGLSAWPGVVPSVVFLGPFLLAPVFWFRQLTLFGVSHPSHGRTLPVALVQPLLALVGFYWITAPTVPSLASVVVDFLVAFVCVIVVLHAADRPIRREFHSSGVSLIRPLLDHVGSRKDEATHALEAFFLRKTVEADLRVDLLAFSRAGRPPLRSCSRPCTRARSPRWARATSLARWRRRSAPPRGSCSSPTLRATTTSTCRAARR